MNNTNIYDLMNIYEWSELNNKDVTTKDIQDYFETFIKKH